MRKVLKAVISILAIGVIGYSGYYLHSQVKSEKNAKGDLQAKNDGLQKELADTRQAMRDIEDKNLINSDTNKVSCPSILTADEQSIIQGWKTYKNSSRKYSFKYPSGWAVSGQGDQIELSYAPSKISMSFRSGGKAAIDLSSMNKEKSEQTIVDCVSATQDFYSSDVSKTIATLFKRGGVLYAVTMAYEDQGASFSGDVSNTYNLILKTIEFSSR